MTEDSRPPYVSKLKLTPVEFPGARQYATDIDELTKILTLRLRPELAELSSHQVQPDIEDLKHNLGNSLNLFKLMCEYPNLETAEKLVSHYRQPTHEAFRLVRAQTPADHPAQRSMYELENGLSALYHRMDQIIADNPRLHADRAAGKEPGDRSIG